MNLAHGSVIRAADPPTLCSNAPAPTHRAAPSTRRGNLARPRDPPRRDLPSPPRLFFSLALSILVPATPTLASIPSTIHLPTQISTLAVCLHPPPRAPSPTPYPPQFHHLLRHLPAALLKVEVCGICGTDVKLYKTPPTSAPVIMGHENIGVIAKAEDYQRQAHGGDTADADPDAPAAPESAVTAAGE